MRWAVIHLIHVHFPHRHIPRLIVEEVPDEITAEEVKQAIVRAGLQPHEFGVPWANHYVAREDEWPDEVAGTYANGEAPTVDWGDLAALGRGTRKLTLRVSSELHAALLRAAERRGVSLQALCVEALGRVTDAADA